MSWQRGGEQADATENLATATSYSLLMVFALTDLALWRLKRRTSQPEGMIDIPRWIPTSVFAASLGFLLLQLLIDVDVF